MFPQWQLDQMWHRQLHLARQFNEIETRNSGLNHTIPLDLFSYSGQAVIRLFTTYFWEEMWESADATEQDKVVEELSDALHYLIEICLMVDLSILKLMSIRSAGGSVAQTLGRFLYALRKRPAKQKPVDIDIQMIHARLAHLFHAYLEYAQESGVTTDQLYEAYLGKAEVNQQRIDTKA